jgi:hypothetical protein
MRRALLVISIGFMGCRVEPRQPTYDAPRTPTPQQGASIGATRSIHSGAEAEPTAEPPEPTGVTIRPPDALTSTSTPEYDFQGIDALKHPIALDAVARRNANLTTASCVRQLRAKKYPFRRVGAFKGIATPVRVDGEIEGVKFRVPGVKSKFGVLDCRLALTLVEFARFLKAVGVVQVTVDNFYRPNAHLPGKRSKRSQHAYGLAIDLTSFILEGGQVLSIEDDWGAGSDTEPCGPRALLTAPTENTVKLRELVCNLVTEQIFHHHLTPSHDLAHRNHLHLDIKRDEASVTAR